jgi:DNA modification methylase
MEPNNIYWGNSYVRIKEVETNSIDLIVTDPPYEFADGGGGGSFGVRKRSYHNDVSKNKTINCGIKEEILFEFERVQKKTNIYIFCNKNQLRQYFNFYQGKNVELLIWEKTNPIPTINGKFLSNVEYIFFARAVGAFFETVYERASKVFRTPLNTKDKKLFKHPTIKPESIIETLILNSSKKDHIVFDPFLGSGTTAYCAKKHGRRYIGIELEERYVKIAKDRLDNITANERELRESGQISIFDMLKSDI